MVILIDTAAHSQCPKFDHPGQSPFSQSPVDADSGTTSVQTSPTSSRLLPTYHKQFTVRVLPSLQFVYSNLTPRHISSIHSRGRLASSDSSSQRTRPVLLRF
ncbi:Hypothetical predicted protein [Xyrichtys novacula]|uniref:Uncharacterized protein n=1 Tax=Xyrichtys novacula TaxID=13765 RepID=A0AAV1F5T8_XYRNO|nr:Hypothetical predicted protein [Xyrichtys novacula]